MEELPRKNNSLESDSSCFHGTDVFAKKHQEQRQRIMFEGKNIHSSPIDGKLLCSYSEKRCKQRRLNGYAFCIRHVLEDRQAPFKQCQFVAKYNGHQCTNPIPVSEDRIYCNSHLQVLGLVPKKSKRKKTGEHGGCETDKLVLPPEPKGRPDVFSTLSSTNNISNPPMAFPFRLKRPKLKLESTEPKIPAIEELKESRGKLRRDRDDLFAIYGIDSSDSESSDSEQLPWQQMWLSSDNEHKAAHEDTRNSHNVETASRTAKISKLSSRLRRELHQLRRTLRAHHYRSKDLQSLSITLLRAAHTDTGVCVDSLFQGDKASRRQRSKPTPCPQKVCASVQNENQCTKTALPYTKFCLDHIMSETKQELYAQCTAKWPGGLQCSVPVFDISHERPLCEEHALKKAKSQEAQVQAQAAAVARASPALTKQQPKKPRRKPQPRATPGTKVPRPAKKPSSRKATPTSGKLKTSKGLDASLTGGMNHSFSPDNTADILSPSLTLPLSSDYSHNSEPSPMSSDGLTDFEQFGNPLFESHQQDRLLLPNVSDEENGDNILSGDLPPTTNGRSPEQHIFPCIENQTSPVVRVPRWSSVVSSVPAAVISVATRAHAPLNSFHAGAKMDPKSKSSALNRKNKGNQPPKPTEPKKSQNQTIHLRGSMMNLLQNSRFISTDPYARDKSVNSLSLSSDPMFSPLHALSSDGGLKTHSNGEHVHSPSHIEMDMEAILSPTDSAWLSVPGGLSPAAYISPLNSQTTISRLAVTSPPFSPSAISPHISSHPSLFTFDKTQLQQTHLSSPASPPPFMQSGQLKQHFHHHNDLEHQESDAVDPFLPSVQREQSIFGSHITQNSDSNHGDLRLR